MAPSQHGHLLFQLPAHSVTTVDPLCAIFSLPSYACLYVHLLPGSYFTSPSLSHGLFLSYKCVVHQPVPFQLENKAHGASYRVHAYIDDCWITWFQKQNTNNQTELDNLSWTHSGVLLLLLATYQWCKSGLSIADLPLLFHNWDIIGATSESSHWYFLQSWWEGCTKTFHLHDDFWDWRT